MTLPHISNRDPDDTLHYGDIYTGETVAEVAAEILEGLPYEIDPIVGDIKLYGWLPIDTKRNPPTDNHSHSHCR